MGNFQTPNCCAVTMEIVSLPGFMDINFYKEKRQSNKTIAFTLILYVCNQLTTPITKRLLDTVLPICYVCLLKPVRVAMII